MSHINFDFLTESFLFGYGLEDNFSALSDYELEKELNRYREYVISNMGEICREIIFDSRRIVKAAGSLCRCSNYFRSII